MHSSSPMLRASRTTTVAVARRYAATNERPPLRHRPLRKLLVANRGEIACRVMRTAKAMGLQTVAVFSDADKHAMHVHMADEAYRLGEAAASASYLDGGKLLSIAARCGADAVHPGYGFLSENAPFSEACHRAGVTFVGPPAQAITDMGIKNRAKQIMHDAGVPVVSGYHGDEQSDQRLYSEAESLGFPVMLKAVYGGGGKGMRVAHTADQFGQALDSARREAAKAFGNGDMLIEQFVHRPRHVEVQVFGDTHGNYVSLHERDCSVQRRHQKIIEEAPAPGIADDTRAFLADAAVRAARAVHYVGAGTVEFIMDDKQKFYFMEMNTRLQVEHPVTEMITGFDLVEWQLLVAAGHPLPVTRNEDVPLNGHAVECRVYAEDPDEDFMPHPGHLVHLSFPPPTATWHSHVRVDTGVRQGDRVSVHYDPMIAKLVTWSPAGRRAAIDAMTNALAHTKAVGVKTNVHFLHRALNHDDFVAGDVYTDFIPDRAEYFFAKSAAPKALHSFAAPVAALLLSRQLDNCKDTSDPFASMPYFRVNLEHTETVTWCADDSEYNVDITHGREGLVKVSDSDGSLRMAFDLIEAKPVSGGVELTYTVDESADGGPCRRHSAVWHTDADGLRTLTMLTHDAQCGTVSMHVKEPKWLAEVESGAASGDALSHGPVAPMPGVVEKVLVAHGDTVQPGQPLVVMVAMKMEYIIKSATAGSVVQVQCAPGDSVQKGQRLIEVE